MYDLELTRVIDEITKGSCKNIMIQLPDGLKPKAMDIVDTIREKTGANCYIWFTSCYGACDIPLGLTQIGIDLFVQWGHNRFHRTKWTEGIDG